MKTESLEIALDSIISKIEELDIDLMDKVELMCNLSTFLKSSQYEENIKVLSLYFRKEF